MSNIPNCIYIGTSKAGSTWIYNLLDHHPDIYMSSNKGLYFFDSHYDHGLDWYLSYFQPAGNERVIGEVSHSYLSSRIACERIAQLNPNAKMLVCLRNPVDRAFSDYLDAVKNGGFEGTFEDALDAIPRLIDRGRYATHLKPYLDTFGADSLHVGVFDELVKQPESFAEGLFNFLEVDQIPINPALTKKMMPAGAPRSKWLSKLSKHASAAVKNAGLRKLRTRVKTSRIVRNLLYRQFTPKNKPKPAPETKHGLREQFRDEITALDSLLGGNFAETWGYNKR